MSRPEYAVFLGLDVGKESHHACGLDPGGERVHDKVLPQDEAKLRSLFAKLSKRGRVLVIVDQPATIGALPVTVARAEGIDVAYLPGLAMRRAADLYPGSAKTDAIDAFVIAETARSMPHTLLRVDTGDEALADLEVIVGFDDDLAGEATRVMNRIRGLLSQIHPALEHALNDWMDNKAVLELLRRFGGPTGLRAAGRRRLSAVAKPRAPRIHAKIVDAIMAALDQQSVVVPGTAAAEIVLPKLAAQYLELQTQRQQILRQVEQMLDAHPLSPVLRSMPGIGPRTGSRILLEVGDGSAFPTPGHLAAYAGLTPITRRSGTSIKGEHPNPGGNKKLKNAMFRAAFGSLSDPASRAYYDRKRAEKKKHNAALICLARRRCDVLFAMLRDGTLYQAKPPAAA